MTRFYIDCRDYPGDVKCSVALAADTKEELLDALVEQFISEIMKTLEPVVNKVELNALDKLQLFYQTGGMYKVENLDRLKALISALYDSQNLLLRHKLNQRSVQLTLPYLTQIFQQGIDEKVFEISEPREVALLILQMGVALGEYNAHLFQKFDSDPKIAEQLCKNLQVYEQAITRILGVTTVDFRLFQEEFFHKILGMES